ncbi:MAG TPA: hypothetical protein VIL47_02940 [Candidatus Bipolaricaulota bacterium]
MSARFHKNVAVWIVCLLMFFGSGQAQSQGTPPDITFIDFPSVLDASAGPRVGRVYFKDAQKDVVQAQFAVVQAQSFDGFTLDLAGLIQSDGVFDFFEFQLAPSVNQQVTLEVTLSDSQNLKSQPRQFSFSVVGATGAATEAPSTTPRIELDPTSLSFQAQVNGPNPPAQVFRVLYEGTTSFFWRASVDVPWIQLSRSDGPAPASVTVTVDVADLPTGSHVGQIAIGSDGVGNSPQTLFVLLSVTSASSQAQTVSGQLLAVAFQALEFLDPGVWQISVQSGCFWYTNADQQASLVSVTSPNGAVQEYAIPAGKTVISCGSVVLIDTRV